MKLNRFEMSIIGGMVGAWIQLMCGFPTHAFFSLGVFAIICLMGIIEYLRLR